MSTIRIQQRPRSVIPWLPFAIGIPFLAVGIPWIYFGIQTRDGRFGSLGVLSTIGGLIAIYYGMVNVSRILRRSSVQPLNPWTQDFYLNPRIAFDDSRKNVVESFLVAVLLASALCWVYFGTAGPGYFIKILLGVLTVLAAFFMGYAFHLLVRYAKFGRTQLRFERFPFFLGETMDAGFLGKGLGKLEKMTITLRCIEEVMETDEDRTSQVICYQLYADSIRIEAPVEHLEKELPITFLLPKNNHYSTRLTARFPRYWELEIEAVKLAATRRLKFVVPIYARPGG